MSDLLQILKGAETYLRAAETHLESQHYSDRRKGRQYLEAAERKIEYVAGRTQRTPLSGTVQVRLRTLKERLERMQQRKDGMDYYTAARLLQRALQDRESAREARKAKRFRDARRYAEASAFAQARVEREASRDVIQRLGSLYRNAVRNNPKLMQSIRDEEEAHGHNPYTNACSAPAPALPAPVRVSSAPVRVNRTTTTTGGFVLNLTTTTARTIDGIVGQVVLNDEVVYQTKAFKDKKNAKGNVTKYAADRARAAANARIHDQLKDLLAESDAS